MTGHGKVKALEEMKIKTINEESRVFKTEIFINPYIKDQIIISQGKNTVFLEMKDVLEFVEVLEYYRDIFLYVESENQSSTTKKEE